VELHLQFRCKFSWHSDKIIKHRDSFTFLEVEGKPIVIKVIMPPMSHCINLEISFSRISLNLQSVISRRSVFYPIYQFSIIQRSTFEK
jgi:hypothetical protein